MVLRTHVLVPLLVLALPCSAGPTSEDVARLIRQLGSENFREREEANRRLDAIGEPALEQLRKAAGSSDAEVRRRARELSCTIEIRIHGELRCLIGHQGEIWSLALSPDGKQLLSSGADKVPRLWSLDSARAPRLFPDGAEWSRFPVFSPDGKHALSGASDNTLRLWELATSKEVRRFEGASGLANGLAYSLDGRRVFAISCNTLLAWDSATGKRLYAKKTPQAVGLAVSPDGRLVATSGMDHAIRLWDAATGRELRECKGHTAAVWNVTFSPDGRWLLSAGWDGSARLWDAATGKELRRFEGHGQVYSATFSPDGRRVLTAGADGVVRLWGADTAKELHCYEGHTGPVWRALFCADGRRAVSSGSDQTIRLWAVPK